ncbi:hypothetical protein AnigIFM59636_010541 [Aspergillus niger]|nr:hypothetical protein AnigIFM59636_010541 [Aspergillus niger]
MPQRPLSMLSTASRVRRGLDNLFGRDTEYGKCVPVDGHMDMHNLKSVEHVVRFDFEHLNDPKPYNSTISPPVLFRPILLRPMESSQLQKSYPTKCLFANIDQFIGKVSPKTGCSQISSLVHVHATRKAMLHRPLEFVG